mgnify:CR=1 FL=1
MTDPWLTALNDSIATVNALHPDERPITPSQPDALDRHHSEPDDGGWPEQVREDKHGGEHWLDEWERRHSA